MVNVDILNVNKCESHSAQARLRVGSGLRQKSVTKEGREWYLVATWNENVGTPIQN